MHERRNTALTLILAGALLWAAIAWIAAAAIPQIDLWPSLLGHRIASILLLAGTGAGLVYGLYIQDKLPDDLRRRTLGEYFEQDGICFLPMTRVVGRDGEQRAEISLYYQNRYAGPAEIVVHIRPPAGALHSHRGARDVHFAFRCESGAFGVIHQPIAVAPHAQGQPVTVELAAAVRWLRSRGEQLRSHRGRAVGTFDVDWALAYRQSEHELGGEIELKNPARLHLLLPDNVATEIERGEFVNEVLATPA